MKLLRQTLSRAARPGLRSMVACVLARECDGPVPEPEVQKTAEALEERILAMPAHLSAGMLGLTTLFDASGVLRGSRASKIGFGSIGAKLCVLCHIIVDFCHTG